MERAFRRAKRSDWKQIDEIRFDHGSTSPRAADVEYHVCERDGKITALFGLKREPGRALVVDLYGRNARDWMALLNALCSNADRDRIELSGWTFLNNKNIKTLQRAGFMPTAYLMRRQPQYKEVAA